MVVRETDDGARLLLLRAYKNWDFPKGQVETGEEVLAAAVRETREEAGIDDLEFAWGWDYVETEPYARDRSLATTSRVPAPNGSRCRSTRSSAAPSTTSTVGSISLKPSPSPRRVFVP